MYLHLPWGQPLEGSSTIWLLPGSQHFSCKKLQYLNTQWGKNQETQDILYLLHRLYSDKHQSDHFCIEHPSVTFTVLPKRITKQKHASELSQKKIKISIFHYVNPMLFLHNTEFHYVKPMLFLYNSEDKTQTLAGAVSTFWSLFLHHGNLLHWVSLGSKTTTLSRLPPQESNSPFLQVNQADAVNCPNNSVHASFQAMPHPATSQTGLKRKGAIHLKPLLYIDAKSYERRLAGLPEHAVFLFLLNARKSSWELIIWMETMVTIPVPPQSIAFPADSLSLPAVVSIQYSLSCFLSHVSHSPAPGDSSKKIWCISSSFQYQVIIVKNPHRQTLIVRTHHTSVQEVKNTVPLRRLCSQESEIYQCFFPNTLPLILLLGHTVIREQQNSWYLIIQLR